VENVSWSVFFIITTLMMLPGIVLLVYLMFLDKKNS
jgi:uncharacterized membrane protein YdjX (TVP38/TMEM64 family)